MMKVLVYPLLLVAFVLVAFGCESSDPAAAGTGGTQCLADQTLCGGSCVALASSADHCGACNNACPVGTSCVGSQCSCQTGLTSCSGSCVDITSDPAHCGTCSMACPATQVCSLGTCADSCAANLTQCGQSCVDVTTSVLHCGICNNQCPGGRLCQSGACACERATDVDCGGVCVDTQSDPANCGGCGIPCPAGVACMAGVCSGATGDAIGFSTGTGSSTTGGSTVAFINERGRVSADSNPFGLQGDWYAFGDGVTSTESGNPFRAPGMYCISGEAPGDEDFSAHWGAGIGFDLNSMGATKMPYEFAGRLNGFRMTLMGTAPTPPRVHFVNTLEDGVTPFTLASLDESKTYWIAEAQVPLDWGVDNAGARIESGPLYSLQVLAPGAEAAGPIDLCITEFEPIFDPDYTGPVIDDGPFINSDGFVAADNNEFGIEGPVYVISDGNSTTQSGNPYRDGKYCVAGEFSGADADWGAGIAFDMSKPPGGERQLFTHGDTIAGFRIGLSGSTPGWARIQFVTNEPPAGDQPFLGALLNGSMGYRIAWAEVPSSWDVENAGVGVGEAFYTVQLYLEGTEPGPFDVCIEEFEPVTASQIAAPAQAAAAGYNGARTIDTAVLAREYEIWKAARLRDCGDGTACVPRDEGDCISEGVAYGMLIAVGFDDQATFDKLWAYYNAHKNANGVMDWQTAACGNTTSNGSATDGELDAAMALIQAGCRWGGNYESDALQLIAAIKNSEVTSCNGNAVLKPGDNFGGCDETNPSYFAPAYFKVFQELTGDSTWTDLVDDGYTLLSTLQSTMGGLVPDWSDADGNPEAGDRGDYGPDASRTPWRIATDYVWTSEPRAATFLDAFSAYLEQNGGVPGAFTPNSNFRGAAAMSGWHQDSTKAQEYTDAWLSTAVDDKTYFPGTLRPIYMLLGAHQFPKGCN